MKKIKILFGIFTLSMLVAISSTSAAHYQSFIGIKLRAFSGIYNSAPQTKEIKDFQHVYTTGARDNLSGDKREISAQTRDSSDEYTSWISANIGTYASWGDQNEGTGAYTLRLRAKKSTMSSTTYNGIWYLDESAM